MKDLQFYGKFDIKIPQKEKEKMKAQEQEKQKNPRHQNFDVILKNDQIKQQKNDQEIMQKKLKAAKI